MRHRFTRICARLMVVTGIIFIVLGVALSGVALVTEDWRQSMTGTPAAVERAIIVGFLLLSGVLAGSPFVVVGLLLEIALDQRLLLMRIHRRLRRLGESPGAEGSSAPAARDRYPRLG